MTSYIRGYVGANGHGKTYACVHQLVIPAWRVGRPVVSNMALYPERLGFSPELYRPFSSWRELPDMKDCVLVLDEISSVFPSRQSLSMPPQLARKLNQLRKDDVILAWSAPNWARADKILREVTQTVTVCRSFMEDRWVRVPGKASKPRLHTKRVERISTEWRPRRLFSFSTYDAIDMQTEFDNQGSSKLRPMSVDWHWRPWHDSGLAYDTAENVMLLDHLDDNGVCIDCGGTRTRPRCDCGKGGHHHEHGAAATAATKSRRAAPIMVSTR